MTNAELIYSLRYCFEKRKTVVGVPWYVWCDRAADALEAAEKRIAIAEEERDLEHFAAMNYLDKIGELEAQLPKEGEWIGDSYDFHCSICGVYQNFYTGKTNYCPNCGARMRGANDEQ